MNEVMKQEERVERVERWKDRNSLVFPARDSQPFCSYTN